jgi:hypothetical protein
MTGLLMLGDGVLVREGEALIMGLMLGEIDRDGRAEGSGRGASNPSSPTTMLRVDDGECVPDGVSDGDAVVVIVGVTVGVIVAVGLLDVEAVPVPVLVRLIVGVTVEVGVGLFVKEEDAVFEMVLDRLVEAVRVLLGVADGGGVLVGVAVAVEVSVTVKVAVVVGVGLPSTTVRSTVAGAEFSRPSVITYVKKVGPTKPSLV